MVITMATADAQDRRNSPHRRNHSRRVINRWGARSKFSSISPAEIVAAIRDLHQGGSPMPPQVARREVQQTQTRALPVEELGDLSVH